MLRKSAYELLRPTRVLATGAILSVVPIAVANAQSIDFSLARTPTAMDALHKKCAEIGEVGKQRGLPPYCSSSKIWGPETVSITQTPQNKGGPERQCIHISSPPFSNAQFVYLLGQKWMAVDVHSFTLVESDCTDLQAWVRYIASSPIAEDRWIPLGSLALGDYSLIFSRWADSGEIGLSHVRLSPPANLPNAGFFVTTGVHTIQFWLCRGSAPPTCGMENTKKGTESQPALVSNAGSVGARGGLGELGVLANYRIPAEARPADSIAGAKPPSQGSSTDDLFAAAVAKTPEQLATERAAEKRRTEDAFVATRTQSGTVAGIAQGIEAAGKMAILIGEFQAATRPNRSQSGGRSGADSGSSGKDKDTAECKSAMDSFNREMQTFMQVSGRDNCSHIRGGVRIMRKHRNSLATSCGTQGTVADLDQAVIENERTASALRCP